MNTPNIPNIPRLETPQTKRILEEYPPLEYLESDYVADWLQTRKDQLLESAKEERSGINLSKTLGLICGFAGFIFHATSPLAPLGALMGVGGYVFSMFKDLDQTGSFAPIPFIRGNFLEVVGNLGHADLRNEYLSDRDNFEDLKTYLPPKEREEYLMLKDHLHTMTDYLTQVPPLKRFHAYEWLLQNYINLKGCFPTTEQLSKHVEKVNANYDRVSVEVIEAIREKVKPILPQLAQPITGSLPEARIRELPTGTQTTHVQQLQTVLQNTTQIQKSRGIDFNQLRSLPLQQRASAVINLLAESGFNVSGCIQGQTTVVAGQQRGGKGTLLAILATLAKALDQNQKIYYFTAGTDTYPFQCEKLVCANNFPASQEPNAKVAQELIKFLKEMSNAEVGTWSDRILVIDEAIALSGHLTEEDKQFMAKFLLTQAEKTGCQTFVVLHASNLTAWIGAKNTAGLADTFKSSVTFIGCKSKSVQINPLKTISVATGEYFLADPNSFGKSIPDGELGIIPEWLKKETNPKTGQPDPARTLLSIFPELMILEDDNNWLDDGEEEEIQERVYVEKNPVQDLKSAVQDLKGTNPVQSPVHDSEPLLDRDFVAVTPTPEPGSELSSRDKNRLYTPLNLSEPQLRGMIEIMSGKMTETEIIQQLWSVTKGGSKAYEQARAEFKMIKGESVGVE